MAAEKVPCMFCGDPTPMTSTKQCDRCWELYSRLQSVSATILSKMVAQLKKEYGMM